MFSRKRGPEQEANRTADVEEHERHTSTNRRIASSSTRSNESSVRGRGLYANAPKFDPRNEDIALKPSFVSSIGTPRARSAESTTSRRATTTQNRPTNSIVSQLWGRGSSNRSSAENRLRRFLTPHYPSTEQAVSHASVRSSSASPVRNFRRDDNLYSSARTYSRRDERLSPSFNKDAGWQQPNITRKSILRHSIGIDNPRRYTETIDSYSSSSDTFSSDKRVRFQDQIRVKRKVVPSPELVQLVRTDSETSLTSSSSGNLHSTSEVSVSSGTGSLPEYHLVDYSLGSNSGSEGASRESQGSAGRQARQYSSNDSDYSTENESLYGIDKLRKSETHYSSRESVKSSAYSSSSSVKSSQGYTGQSRPRIKSESSEDEPVQRHIKKINLKEVHAESDEDMRSDGSNSTLADSSSSESEIVLASGIVIKREKFTSGSEFESSSESTEGYAEVDKKGSWFMTVKEHRASSPSNYDHEDQVLEKEIFFKFKPKNNEDIVEEELVPEAQFISVENVELEEVSQVKRPTPRRPIPVKPMEIVVHETMSDSESEFSISVEEAHISQENQTPEITDLESLKSVTIHEGEMDDLTEGSISLTHITTLDGSLTQMSVFTLPVRDKHTPSLEEIKSARESSESSSTRGIHAPYHLVKQIVKQNEALHQLQQQGKLNKLVSYSCSSLSSIDTEHSESQVSLVEDLHSPSAFAPGYFYDSFGNKKRVMVSTGTSTVFQTGSRHSLEGSYENDLTESNLKADEAKKKFLDQHPEEMSSDIATVEIVLLDPYTAGWQKQRSLVSMGVQTDQEGSKRLSLQKQSSTPSAFEEYSRSKSKTSSDFAEKDKKDSESLVHTIDTGNLISSLRTLTSQSSNETDEKHNQDSRPGSVIKDVGKASKTAANKRFAYKKEKRVDETAQSHTDIDMATSGDGRIVEDFSTSSGKNSVIDFHESHEEKVSTTDLLESLSSNSNDSPLSSDTEELRVSLKMSRDLSKSDSNASEASDDDDSSKLDPASETFSTLEVKPRTSELSVNLKNSKEEHLTPGVLLKSSENSSKSGSSNSVQSADQRLIESILNEVEEMIIESKTCSNDEIQPEQESASDSDSSLSHDKLEVTDAVKTQEYSENITTSLYSVGEVVLDPKKSGAVYSTKSESIDRHGSAEKGSTKLVSELSTPEVLDKYLLYLKDKSSSSSESGSQVSINTSAEKLVESEFEKLHREMKDMFESRSQRSLASKTTSNSTLGRIPSIKSSSSESLTDHNVMQSGSGLSFERESSTGDDRVVHRQDDSDDQVTLETISEAVDGKSLTSSRFRRKSSYGAISDPENTLPQPARLSRASTEGRESDGLLASRSSSKSKHTVPRLSKLSSNQKSTDANKASKRDHSFGDPDSDSFTNKKSKKSSSKSSAFSKKLKASSGKPGAKLGKGLVDYELTGTGVSATAVTSEDDLSLDETELDDLVYSLKIDNPSEENGEAKVEMFCENCRSESCSCESSNTNTNSEMTDSSRYKRGRWKDNYGVLRALKWVFCPCRDA